MSQQLPVRTRPRAAATAAATPTRTRSAAPTKAVGWLKRGGDIFSTADAEAAKAEERAELRKAGLANVQRFRLKPGEQAEIIILDENLNSVVAFYEHNLPDSRGRYGTYETCVKEFANCPVCDRFDESYYAMHLTILDLRGYDRKLDGGKQEHVPHVRQLLTIKSGQIGKWRGIAEAAIEETGTLRGTYMVLRREKGEKSANIGEPVLLKGARLYDITPEDQLVQDYGHEEIIGRDNKTVIKAENADITPYDYDKLFPEPDVDGLMSRYGGEPGAGSAQEVVKEFGERTTGSKRTRPRPSAAAEEPTRTRRRPAAEAPTEEEPVGDEVTGDPAEGEEPFEE